MARLQSSFVNDSFHPYRGSAMCTLLGLIRTLWPASEPVVINVLLCFCVDVG